MISLPQPNSVRPSPKGILRCAIYTRKSTDEGLDREFNSLDAQREAGEAYIKSQQHEGWLVVAESYDDGGYSGGTIERPALKRLMADIAAGLIDCVVVYKVDRLSRSLLDFTKLVGLFDQHGIAFVSVTQQFNTASSMGRLMLNVLLSFAQFEREIISERTRDKMAATRRKGRFCGGRPILGYDIDPAGRKLLVNAEEAERVRAIFALYLKCAGLIGLVAELADRGWTNKVHMTRDGKRQGGRPFDKQALYQLLRNVTYRGQVRYKKELHPGVHEPIIDEALWEEVQQRLADNGRNGGTHVKHSSGALLKGLLFCTACGGAMTPTHTTKAGKLRYRYYVCTTKQARGRQACATRTVAADDIEAFVLARIRTVGSDRQLQAAVLAATRRQAEERLEELSAESRALSREAARRRDDIQRLFADVQLSTSQRTDRLADLQELLERPERRAAEIEAEAASLRTARIEDEAVLAALEQFDGVWDALTIRERVRLVQLLVRRVDYDDAQQKLLITFHTTELASFAGPALEVTA